MARLGHLSSMALISSPALTKITSLSPCSAIIANFSCVKTAYMEKMTLHVGHNLIMLFTVIMPPFPLLALSLPV
jgi:hypothetical protein